MRFGVLNGRLLMTYSLGSQARKCNVLHNTNEKHELDPSKFGLYEHIDEPVN